MSHVYRTFELDIEHSLSIDKVQRPREREWISEIDILSSVQYELGVDLKPQREDV